MFDVNIGVPALNVELSYGVDSLATAIQICKSFAHYYKHLDTYLLGDWCETLFEKFKDKTITCEYIEIDDVYYEILSWETTTIEDDISNMVKGDMIKNGLL
jgi:hypothetical protein